MSLNLASGGGNVRDSPPVPGGAVGPDGSAPGPAPPAHPRVPHSAPAGLTCEVGQRRCLPNGALGGLNEPINVTTGLAPASAQPARTTGLIFT